MYQIQDGRFLGKHVRERNNGQLFVSWVMSATNLQIFIAEDEEIWRVSLRQIYEWRRKFKIWVPHLMDAARSSRSNNVNAPALTLCRSNDVRKPAVKSTRRLKKRSHVSAYHRCCSNETSPIMWMPKQLTRNLKGWEHVCETLLRLKDVSKYYTRDKRHVPNSLAPAKGISAP